MDLDSRQLEPLTAAIDREAVRRGGLAEFARRAWHIVEPSVEYRHNWHVDEIATHLAACVAGYHTDKIDARKLVINVPPGSMKSLLISVFLTPWIWTFNPGFQVGYASHDIKLVQRDARKALMLLESEWYQRRWPEVKLRTNSQSEVVCYTKAGGLRYGTTVESGIVGFHFDLKVVDDPTKPLDAMGTSAVTAVQLEKVKQWWNGTLSTRNKDPANARYCLIMQRLHENDLAGHLIATDSPTVLRLPMRFEPENRCWNEGIGGDRRMLEGQLLWPERFPEASVAKLERDLGVYASAQLQQNPISADGEVFKGIWFKYWTELPKFSYHYLSVDCSFASTSASDFVSIQVWGKSGPNFYLVHEVLERLSFTETLAAIRQVLSTYRVGPKLIEKKANGDAVIDMLGKSISGIIPVNPAGGKVARARAVTYLHQAGNVYYPPPDRHPWSVRHTNQLLGFPKARNDDSVDAETQFLYYASQNGGAVLDTMAALRNRSRG